MKYFAVCLLIAPLQLFSQLTPLPQSKDEISAFSTPRSTHLLSTPPQRNSVVLFEDFQSVNVPELPENWDGGAPVEQQQDNDSGIGLGTYVDAWQTGDAYSVNNGGYIPVPHINNNLFVFVNDDGDPCNCDMENVGLMLPELSFDGLDNMMMTFDIYSQSTFGGDNISLEISTNGTDFITIFTAESSPDWQPVLIDLSPFDDASSVWLRFGWSDNGFWSTGGAIDNILVAEKLDYNAGIIRAHTAEYTADWNDTASVSGEYSSIPLEQATPLKPGATVVNKGALAISDVVLSATILFDGESVGTYNSQIIGNMLPMADQDVYISTDFTPTEIGTYTMEYELLATEDEDLSDNSATRAIHTSADVYAMDDDNADSFRDNSDLSFTVGNLFEIPNDGSICYSIGVGIGASSSVGTEIMVRLYSSDYIYITGSAPYEIQSADRNTLGQNKITNIPLTEPYELEGGHDYIAVVTYFADGSNQFAIANSGSSQEQFSVFQDEIGDWFFVTTTPMVRMNLASSVDVHEVLPLESAQIVPNPIQNDYSFQWPEAQTGPAQIVVSDIQGRMVLQQEVRLVKGQIMNKPVDLDGLAPGFYQFTAIQQNRKTTVRFLKGQ